MLISYVKNLRNRRSLLVPLRGFTLAEVLITLGIIGVVAALTIPTLMQKTNERETVSKVKKFVSTVTNAVKIANVEQGKFECTTPKEFYDYLEPYLNIQKYCGTGTGCWADENINYLAGGQGINVNRDTNYEKAVLSDGSSLRVYASDSENSPELMVDTNGLKGPNKLGVDIFAVTFNRETGNINLQRGNANTNTYPNSENIIQACDTKLTNVSSNGYLCIRWIFHNDNMDYLHCDDLSWDGKTKCD
ncbi:type II secretion system protein [bacterium]|nr:type II secretion system protein [bacterium]